MKVGSLSQNERSDLFEPPIDGYNRRINYLRISITDRCNLRCLYCTPDKGVPRLSHDEILRYEEILRLVELGTKIGITKIRITGGEPLVRRNVLHLCEKIARLPDIQSISITTNGILLSQFAKGLSEAGIRRLNVSMDTLRPDKFALITGKNLFPNVWEGIQSAHQVGFDPIKINVVVLKGVNDDEIEALAGLTYTYPFHVRFIELMQFDPRIRERGFLSAEHVLSRLRMMDTLLPARSTNSNGPASYYRFPSALGKIGIISPVSKHFCSSCTRLRVTADGKLRTCLFATEEVDLRALLRQGASDRVILGTIREAVKRKPQGHSLGEGILENGLSRPMFAIGG